MTIISGAVNTSRTGVEDLVAERNEIEIRSIILEQENFGADYIGLNCGTRIKSEAEDLNWLIEIAQDSSDLPLFLDSPDWQVLRDCSENVKNKRDMILDSATAEEERMNEVFSLVKKHDCYAVALLMDESGISDSTEGRMSCMEKIDKRVRELGIDPGRIMIDPLVMPVSVCDQSGVILFDLISQIKKEYPAYRISGGLDNISFGLPLRSAIKQATISMCNSYGMDTFLVVLDQETEETFIVNKLLQGKDLFSEKFLNYYREKVKEYDCV